MYANNFKFSQYTNLYKLLLKKNLILSFKLRMLQSKWVLWYVKLEN